MPPPTLPAPPRRSGTSAGDAAATPAPSPRSLRGLDLVNVFMADVRDGVGVYLAVYLLVVQHWDPAAIGLVVALPGFVSILAQSPAGNLIDRTRHKRALLVIASLVVAGSCLVVIDFPTVLPVAAAQVAMGLIGPVFQPCVSAMSLGLVGPERMRARVGRNESFNHLGNMLAAVVAVLIGSYVSFEGIFYFALLQCAALIAATLLIDPAEIDHERARAAPPAGQAPGSFWHDARALLRDRDIAAFIVALTLWNLANGAMLPMLGQKLGIDAPADAAYYLSLCIIVAQATMVAVAPWAARKAATGRKRVLLLSFLLIPVRALLFASVDHKYALVALQVIDGIGAGIYGVLGIVMMSDLARGTGRFNLLQGLTYACMGVGGAASAMLGGYLASSLGYDRAFVGLALVGAAGAAFFWRFVHERSAADPRASGRR